MNDKPHDQAMAELYRSDPTYAAQLLSSILEDGDQAELLIALRQMAQQHPAAQALQITRLARHASVAQGVQIQPVAAWLAQLAA